MIFIEQTPLAGVIFDMDGLMFDTETVYTETWPPAAREFGYEVSKQQVVGAIGLNAEAGEAYFKGLFGEDFPFYPIRERRLQLAEENIRTYGLRPKKGLHHLIDYLKSRQIPIALATSSDRARVNWYMSLAQLTDVFDAVVCGDEVEKSKPEPDIFLAAAKKIKADIGHCIVLEDSENGIRAAHRAGAFAVMVPDYKQPDEALRQCVYRVFSDLDQVCDFLEQQNSRGDV